MKALPQAWKPSLAARSFDDIVLERLLVGQENVRVVWWAAKV